MYSIPILDTPKKKPHLVSREVVSLWKFRTVSHKMLQLEWATPIRGKQVSASVFFVNHGES